jgi:hypothetical protein
MRDLTQSLLEDARARLYELGAAIAWEIDIATRGELTEQKAYRLMQAETGMNVAEIKDLVAAAAHYGEHYAPACDPRAVGYISRKVEDDDRRDAMIARCIDDHWTYQRAKNAVRDYRPRKKHRPSRESAVAAWDDFTLELGPDADFETVEALDEYAKEGVKQDLKTIHRYLR